MKKLIITIALILSLTACLPEAMNGNSNDVEKEVKKEQSSNTQKQDKQTEVFDTNIDTSSLEKKIQQRHTK
ncbi:hypothetical protein [Microaceticoccus formicicus]|uniref:hypothetical protein n=1 Tax=Microaceticoccus formicicus TaxID=3118105 RepID=UPI003CCFFFE6|nr:hypothetical protein VZL98_07305 [Peptoniphilaceae bacterium AMB_02]